MSNLVGNPEDQFSRTAAHIVIIVLLGLECYAELGLVQIMFLNTNCVL